MHDIQHTIVSLVEQFGSYAALFAFAAAFGETIIALGWFLPGSTILLIMGVLAGQGYLDITVVMIFGILGAWLGDSFNYYLGKRYGTTLLLKPQFHISKSTIEKAHIFLDSYGAKSVFFSRFLPGLKETIPFLAGSVKMNRTKFIIYNILGAIGWSFEFIGTGYLFSSSLSLAQTWMDRGVVVIAIIAGIVLVLWLIKRFLQNNIPIILSILAGVKKGFIQSAPVERFFTRHPKMIDFISKRFDNRYFIGLPLTVLMLSFGYVLILFGGIAEDFLSKDSIIYIDHIVANLMVQWRTPELVHFFTWITYLGRGPVVVCVIVVVSIIFWLYRQYDYFIAFFISVSGSLFLLWVSKLAFHRPRPDIALYFEPTYSFPSGHATIAISLYGFLGYLLICHASTLRAKLNLFFFTTILILCIGFSRIYLGEHYVSDVYAGYLLGTLWVITGVAILKWINYHSIFSNKRPMRYSKEISSFLASGIFVSLLFYLYNFPYQLAVHKPMQPMNIHSICHYFSQKNNRLTRNLLGIQSIPISIIISGNTNPCTILSNKGWKRLSKTKIIQPPLFWHAHEPFCILSKRDGNYLYILNVWKSNLLYHNNKLYIIAANALTGRKWDIIPFYLTDLSKAREYIANELIHSLPSVKIKNISLVSPNIQKYFNGKEYFDDGDVVLVKEK